MVLATPGVELFTDYLGKPFFVRRRRGYSEQIGKEAQCRMFKVFGIHDYSPVFFRFLVLGRLTAPSGVLMPWLGAFCITGTVKTLKSLKNQ
jgi:hypothetical protein